MHNISASVGRGGTNDPADVKLVQQLLNQYAVKPEPLLAETGEVDEQTLDAIERVQESIGFTKLDGRIDPDGKTFRSLVSGGMAPAMDEQAESNMPGVLTLNDLRAIMPNLKADKAQDYFPHLLEAMKEFDIAKFQLRVAAFLAQVAHESAEFRFMREIWGPTKAQLRYEGRRDLGNINPGDGKRFLGRGPIQITGRANYKHYGDLLGVPLEAKPELAETPEVAFRVAGAFWKTHGLNELADAENIIRITKRINGGDNGLDDRMKYYKRAKKVLGL